MIDTILVSRLREFETMEDPWGVGFSMAMVNQALPVKDRLGYCDSIAPWEHAGRVKYFMLHPGAIDPIMIDNICSGNAILAIPTIIDGWHRFFAKILMGARTIETMYGGRVDLLEYLKGQRNNVPL